MIKLICIDMDGTLYSKQKEIFETTKEALKLAVEHGIQIAIVTGRPINYIMAYEKELQIPISMAGSNGGYILANNTEMRYAIPKVNVLRILQLIQKHQLHVFLKSLHHVFTNMEQSKFFPYDELTSGLPERYQMKTLYSSSLMEHIEHSTEDIYKMIVLGDDPKAVAACRKQIHQNMEVSTFSQEAHHFELSAKDATKGNAIQHIADAFHFTLDEVACIGDSDNDIPMFQASGYRIGMGNASEEIKRISDYITDTCDQDGVGKAIQYLYKKQWKP